MNAQRVQAMVGKELRELASNRGLLLSLCALPAIMAVTPWGIAWAYVRQPNDLATREVARYYHVLRDGILPGATLVEALVDRWMGIFLTAPMFLPILISSQAIAGEKEKRTIEPLLASPASEVEILLAKSLAAVLPATLVTWLFFGVFAAGTDYLAWPLLHRILVPDRAWVFAMLVLAPLLSLLGNSIAVAISARVNDPRLAQQLSALCVLPVVGVGTTALAGYLELGSGFYGTAAVVVAAMDLAVLAIARQLFDRERILTRWG